MSAICSLFWIIYQFFAPFSKHIFTAPPAPTPLGMDLPGLASYLHEALARNEGSLESQRQLWKTVSGACELGLQLLVTKQRQRTGELHGFVASLEGFIRDYGLFIDKSW